MPIKTYSKAEKLAKIETALELRYGERKNWAEIAEDLSLARSTLNEWRRSEEYAEADKRWRKILREQARGDLAQMNDEAIDTLYELMKTDKSGYVRFMSATKILELNQVGSELEEDQADQQKELNEFLLHAAKRHEARLGVAEMVRLPVMPGGLLPERIQTLNEEYRDRKVGEAEALEAEFREVASDPPDEE